MNRRVLISHSGSNIRVEVPSVDNRILSIIPFICSAAVLIGAFTTFHKFTLRLLPIWLIPIVFSVMFLLSGITEWQWCLRGVEIFEASPEHLFYRRDGTTLYRKSISIKSGELKDISVMPIGVGGNLIAISSRHGRVYCGRDISKEDAHEIRQLLLSSYGAVQSNG